MRKSLALMFVLASGAQLGCSSDFGTATDSPAATSRGALVDSQAVWGFETLGNWSRSAGTVALSSQHTEGNSSLALSGFTSSQLVSVPTTIGPIRNVVSVDVQIPLQQPNPWYYGTLQLFLSAPSKGVFNQYIGQKDLKQLTPGQFARVDFSVPSAILTQLASGASDLSVTLSTSVPAGAGTYLFDNLQLATVPSVALPYGIQYCDTAPCNSNPPAVVYVCPDETSPCVQGWHTTIVMKVNGRPVTGGTLAFDWQGKVLMKGSGAVNVQAWNLLTYSAPQLELYSYTDQGVPISYYGIQPVWSGVTEINFEATSGSNAQLDAEFFRQTSYQTGDLLPALLTQSANVVTAERNIAGIAGPRPRALFSPVELSGYAEGDSWGFGQANINYTYPRAIALNGGLPNGILTPAAHEMAHEYGHGLFESVRDSYFDAGCLDEGTADALGFVGGFIPVTDLGPNYNNGSYDGDCRPVTESHAVGNCYFYHVNKAGRLNASFMYGIFHPQHRYTASTCTPNDPKTGDSLLVLFTEAAGGVDMTSVIDSMKLPNSGSYAAAKAALGF